MSKGQEIDNVQNIIYNHLVMNQLKSKSSNPRRGRGGGGKKSGQEATTGTTSGEKKRVTQETLDSRWQHLRKMIQK